MPLHRAKTSLNESSKPTSTFWV